MNAVSSSGGSGPTSSPCQGCGRNWFGGGVGEVFVPMARIYITDDGDGWTRSARRVRDAGRAARAGSAKAGTEVGRSASPCLEALCLSQTRLSRAASSHVEKLLVEGARQGCIAGSPRSPCRPEPTGEPLRILCQGSPVRRQCFRRLPLLHEE